jgi:hypothetical protein
MVTSKPTTDARGASSPVTKTEADCGVWLLLDEDEFEDELQPAPSIASASKIVIPR